MSLRTLGCLRVFANYRPPWRTRYEKRYRSATPHDLQTLKHFMDYCVKGWNATQKISRKTDHKKKIGYSTVRQRFTDFLAAWQQRLKNEKIPPKVSTSIYHVRITCYPGILLSCLNILLVYGNRNFPSHRFK
jgi:hypothetical protein